MIDLVEEEVQDCLEEAVQLVVGLPDDADLWGCAVNLEELDWGELEVELDLVLYLEH